MKNYILKIVLFLYIYMLFTNQAVPQTGQLDTTFGQSGFVNTRCNFNHYSSESYSTAIQSDGKIIVVGFTSNGNDLNYSIARYNPNGSLDYTFGINGAVITRYGNLSVVARSVAIQSDGKIIISGFSIGSGGTNQHDFVILRYNPDGSLDNTFGTGGITATNIISGFSFVGSIAIQNDGKIVAGGSSKNVKDYNFTIVRYNTDGTLDDTFGANGIVIAQSGTLVDISMCLQKDGKIVVAGTSYSSIQNSIVLARFTPNGTLDNTFGINGFVRTQIGTAFSFANSVSLQKDQKIVVAGRSEGESGKNFLIARYTTDGILDATFGINGTLTIYFLGLSSGINSVVIQSDDKILAAGFAYSNAENDFALARIYKNGDYMDATFGTNGNGTVLTSISHKIDEPRSLAIQSDGKIIAAGYTAKQNISDFAVVRYTTIGELDSTFGAGGIVTTRIAPSKDDARSVAIQNDGKIIVAGSSYNNLAVARYIPNGDLDIAFGANGISTTSIGTLNVVANSVVIQNDGKTVAAGYSSNGSNRDIVLVRLKTNGLTDNTFGTNGVVTTPIGSSDEEVKSVKIQSDNKIIAAGNSFNGTSYDFAIVRYNSDGTLDDTFGTNGIITTSLGSSGGGVTSLVIQNDNKIVAVGNSYNSFALVRYSSNGDIDNTFGTNGFVTTPIGTIYDFPNSAALQNDGKIVVAGYSSNGTDNDVAIVRYNTNGDLDNTFGTNGVVISPVGAFDDYANSVAIQSDEKIIVSGYSDSGGRNNFIVVRYLSNGDLDSTFGTNGIDISTTGGSSSMANALAIQNDGNIIAVGTSTIGSDYSTFSLIRYAVDAATGIKEEIGKELPYSFVLEQNYPNPFNPTTTINYSIPNMGSSNNPTNNVILKIYDVLGKEIKTLVNEQTKPGVYEITFNASSLASGIYYYRLQFGDFMETKKLVLLK